MQGTKTTTTAAHEAAVQQATAKLRDDATSIRKAFEHYRDGEDEVWDHYTADVDRILATMETDLATAKAALKAQRADSREALRSALDDAARAGQRWLDEIRIQAELGRMELHDRVAGASQSFGQATQEMAHAVDLLGSDASHDLADLRRTATHALDGFRHAAADLSKALLPHATR